MEPPNTRCKRRKRGCRRPGCPALCWRWPAGRRAGRPRCAPWSVSDAALAVSPRECFFSPLTRPAVNPAAATELSLSILLWQQDCSTQSSVATGLPLSILLRQQDCPCPAVATGLLHPMLWQQDCSPHSCAGNRIARCTTSSSGLNCSCPSTGL